MNRVISLATVGLLLATGAAFSQSTERSQPGTTTTTPSTSTTTPSTPQSQSTPTQTQSAPTTQRGQRTEGTNTQINTDRRNGSVNVRGGDREAFRERGSRSGVNVRMRMGGDGYGEGYRYRRHHRFGMYASGCRTVIVKSWRHGHRVVRRISRCG